MTSYGDLILQAMKHNLDPSRADQIAAKHGLRADYVRFYLGVMANV